MCHFKGETLPFPWHSKCNKINLILVWVRWVANVVLLTSSWSRNKPGSRLASQSRRRSEFSSSCDNNRNTIHLKGKWIELNRSTAQTAISKIIRNRCKFFALHDIFVTQGLKRSYMSVSGLFIHSFLQFISFKIPL